MNILHPRRPAIRTATVALAALATSAAMIAAGVTTAQAAPEDQVVLNLLDINDFHGRTLTLTADPSGTTVSLPIKVSLPN